jgi:hypothetical protein
MQFVTQAGRQKALQLLINIVRWIRTVDDLGLLPPGPPSPIGSTFLRHSPYPGKPIAQQSLWHEKHHTHQHYLQLWFSPGCSFFFVHHVLLLVQKSTSAAEIMHVSIVCCAMAV